MNELYDVEFYKKFRRFVKAFMEITYDIKVEGLENIPANQNYLLVGNHLNILDSWLLLTFIDDNLRFMVDKKLYRYKSWENFFKRVGTFSIDPLNMDLKAVKQTLKLLKENENVAIFPEGMTHKVTKSVPFKPGVVRLSRLANKVIVPFGIRGTYVPKTSLYLNFGKPINFCNSGLNKNEEDAYLEEVVRVLERR